MQTRSVRRLPHSTTGFPTPRVSAIRRFLPAPKHRAAPPHAIPGTALTLNLWDGEFPREYSSPQRNWLRSLPDIESLTIFEVETAEGITVAILEFDEF